MKYARDFIPEGMRGGHKLITWAAVQCLPDWQRQLWEPEQLPLANDYSGYGDTYYTRKAELGPFVLLPDGSEPLWEIYQLRLKHHYDFTIDYWESPYYERHVATLTHFIRQIAAQIAAGNIHDAAQFAGTVAHHIEDSGVPAHAVDFGDLEFVKDYMPWPRRLAAFPLHGYTEQSPEPFLINDYRPRLYGTTPEEAGANFLDRYIELTRYARKLMFPLARCACSGNERKAAALRLKAATQCARAYADYLYTATCIGAQRFEPRDRRQLGSLKLTDRWPFRQTAWAPNPYQETGPMSLRGINLDSQRNPAPCALLLETPGGVECRTFAEALGSGAFYEYHYRVPGGAYARFTAQVGIHGVLGARRDVEVEVKLNGRTAFQKKVLPGKPSIAVDIEAAGCDNIQLLASGPHWPTDPNGEFNHVVWARPRLTGRL
jgi:hypothetical protein